MKVLQFDTSRIKPSTTQDKPAIVLTALFVVTDELIDQCVTLAMQGVAEGAKCADAWEIACDTVAQSFDDPRAVFPQLFTNPKGWEQYEDRMFTRMELLDLDNLF